MKATIAELKELMISVGMDKELVQAVDPNLPMFQQGVDSMDYPAIAIATEKRYGVKITDAVALKLKSLNDIVEFIAVKC